GPGDDLAKALDDGMLKTDHDFHNGRIPKAPNPLGGSMHFAVEPFQLNPDDYVVDQEPPKRYGHPMDLIGHPIQVGSHELEPEIYGRPHYQAAHDLPE
ncbi:hypothetical protein FRB98_007259, partial [Tulasnella sp. 332]